jgi:hypothetical protein
MKKLVTLIALTFTILVNAQIPEPTIYRWIHYQYYTEGIVFKDSVIVAMYSGTIPNTDYVARYVANYVTNNPTNISSKKSINDTTAATGYERNWDLTNKLKLKKDASDSTAKSTGYVRNWYLDNRLHNIADTVIQSKPGLISPYLLRIIRSNDSIIKILNVH